MNDELSFGIICDCQYTDSASVQLYDAVLNTRSDRHYRKSPDKLQRAIAAFNDAGVNFALHLGDLADRSPDDYQPLAPILAQAKAPLYQVLGNHDYQAAGNNRQIAMQNLAIDNAYYAVEHGSLRLIILDSNELGVIDSLPGTDRYRAGTDLIAQLKQNGVIWAHEWNGGIGPEQMAWLRSELESATQAGQTIIVAAHHPVFPPGVNNMLNSDEVIEVLNQYPVTAFLNGHNHAGDYGVHNDIPFITFEGMVEGDQDAYSIARLSGGTIAISGFGAHGDYAIPLRNQL